MLCTIYQCHLICWNSQNIPNHIYLPSITPEDYITQSETDIIFILQSTPSVVPSLEYSDRTKNALVKITELLGISTKNPTIVLTVVNPTPTLSHIFLPVKYQRVPVTPVSPPDPYQRLPVSQPTPPHMANKEVSTPKPQSATPPVHNNTTPKTWNKTKRQTHPMILYNAHSVQKYCNIYCISMGCISKLVPNIIFYPSTFSKSKQIPFTTTKEKRKLSPHLSLDLTNMSGYAQSATNSFG